MTKPHLSDLIRLARIGANTLGQTAQSKTMQQVWAIIEIAEEEAAPKPDSVLEQPLTNDKVS